MWGIKSAPHKEFISKLAQARDILKQRQRKGPLLAVLQAEVTKLSLAGASVDFATLSAIETPDEDLLKFGSLMTEVVGLSKGRVVLLIDEIQHLITAPEFEPLQYKLRTLLDELGARISVLYTGSSRKGMEAMFNHPDLPFYNSANQIPFPVLDHHYVHHMVTLLKSQYQLTYDEAVLNAFFKEMNGAAFWFTKLVRHLVLQKCSLEDGVRDIRAQMREAGKLDEVIQTLSQLQKAVLVRIASGLSRYDAEAKRFYTRNDAPDCSRGKIQAAIKSLEARRILTRVADVYFIEHDGLVSAVNEDLGAS